MGTLPMIRWQHWSRTSLQWSSLRLLLTYDMDTRHPWPSNPCSFGISLLSKLYTPPLFLGRRHFQGGGGGVRFEAPCSRIFFHYVPCFFLFCFQARKTKPNPDFWVRISSGGVGVFHVKGQRPKSSICPSKPRETKLFGGISRDFCWDIPGQQVVNVGA